MAAIFDYEMVLQRYIDYHYSGEDRQSIGWIYIQHLCCIVVLGGRNGEPERVVSDNDPDKDNSKPTSYRTGIITKLITLISSNTRLHRLVRSRNC